MHGVKSTWPEDAAARTHCHTGVAPKRRGMASRWNSNNARKIYISIVLSLQNRSRGASTQLWCRTLKMIMFSQTVRLSANYGDAGPRLQYSHVNSTLGIARLCYSHFRLQVWDGKGRDSGGRSRGKVFSQGTIGEREIRAVGLLSSPCILQDSVYINIICCHFLPSCPWWASTRCGPLPHLIKCFVLRINQKYIIMFTANIWFCLFSLLSTVFKSISTTTFHWVWKSKWKYVGCQ